MRNQSGLQICLSNYLATYTLIGLILFLAFGCSNSRQSWREVGRINCNSVVSQVGSDRKQTVIPKTTSVVERKIYGEQTMYGNSPKATSFFGSPKIMLGSLRIQTEIDVRKTLTISQTLQVECKFVETQMLNP